MRMMSARYATAFASVGNAGGSFCVTCPVAAHSVPRCSVVTKSIERLGQHRRGDRPDSRDFVSLQQLRIVRHQKEILVTEARQVVEAVRRDHHRGATVALRLERGAQPSRTLGIQRLPRFVQHDQLQRMPAEHRSQAKQLLHAL